MGSSDPVNNQTLGGVTYNANLFTGRDLGNGKFELKAKHGGETLIFSQQQKEQYYAYSDGSRAEDPREERQIRDVQGTYRWESPKLHERNPRIEMKTDKGWFVDDNNFTIADMMGATFTSSTETVANVNVINSNDVKVDLAANDSGYFGDHATIKGGENNIVIMDSKDSAKINGKSVEGKGTAAQKDY